MIKPHHPQMLPILLDISQFGIELADATYSLGILQGSQQNLHNASLLISPLITVEAAVSSKIEGTQSSAKDVFVYEAGGKPAYADTPLVANYQQAMKSAIGELEKGRRITISLIKSLHSVLLDGCRHEGNLGELRDKQVYIAEKRTDPIEKALYIPPEHILLNDYMENIVKYVNEDTSNALIVAGIMHYQFEAVHPFEDGNGRIGRLLIPLFLYYKKVVTLPIIYVSGYLERNRTEYREALSSVDKTGNYEVWLKYFLKAINSQATETGKVIEKINNLYKETRGMMTNAKSPYMIPFIDFIFERPIFSIGQAMRNLHAGRLTIVRQIESLKEKKLIVELPASLSIDKREKLFIFPSLIDLINLV